MNDGVAALKFIWHMYYIIQMPWYYCTVPHARILNILTEWSESQFAMQGTMYKQDLRGRSSIKVLLQLVRHAPRLPTYNNVCLKMAPLHRRIQYETLLISCTVGTPTLWMYTASIGIGDSLGSCSQTLMCRTVKSAIIFSWHEKGCDCILGLLIAENDHLS